MIEYETRTIRGVKYRLWRVALYKSMAEDFKKWGWSYGYTNGDLAIRKRKKDWGVYVKESALERELRKELVPRQKNQIPKRTGLDPRYEALIKKEFDLKSK